ncbi:Na+/H+ antiporter subunit E [Marisediminicola sp. LYQ134]|uniref:Na+/H+ antiporter subunit E n=1 Tax=unclassified Marisediminicola TaxID=2618316 RepID=UPI0039832C62
MSWLTWAPRLAGFAGWFGVEIVRTNVAVLSDNLTPGQNSAPGIARYDTRCRTEFEITLLGSLITLTPGTLTLGTTRTDAGDWVLYVHGMYNADADDLRSSLHHMESRMLGAVRRKGLTE